MRLCGIMLNPSKASATTSDRTIDKWCAYVRRWHPAAAGADPVRIAVPSEPGTRYRYLLRLHWDTLLESVELTIGNLFAFRATDPKALWSALARGEDVIGPNNDAHLITMATAADIVIAAWGCDDRSQARAADVRQIMAEHGVALHALELSQRGRPKHPLYLSGNAEPVPWTEAA